MEENNLKNMKCLRYKQLKEDNRHSVNLIWGTATVIFPIALIGLVYAMQIPKHQLFIGRGSLLLLTVWTVMTVYTHFLIIDRKTKIEKLELELFENLCKERCKLWWFGNAIMILVTILVPVVVGVAWQIYLIQNPYRPNEFASNILNKRVEIILDSPVDIKLVNDQQFSLISIYGKVIGKETQSITIDPEVLYDGEKYYPRDSFSRTCWFIPYEEIHIIKELK